MPLKLFSLKAKNNLQVPPTELEHLLQSNPEIDPAAVPYISVTIFSLYGKLYFHCFAKCSKSLNFCWINIISSTYLANISIYLYIYIYIYIYIYNQFYFSFLSLHVLIPRFHRFRMFFRCRDIQVLLKIRRV